MRSALLIAIALCLSASNAGATNIQPTLQGATPRAEKSGEPNDSAPHIYKLGEHLSEAYGRYDLVDDWDRFKLKMPPDGYHWVRYGDNYLLVKATDGLITEIVAPPKPPAPG